MLPRVGSSRKEWHTALALVLSGTIGVSLGLLGGGAGLASAFFGAKLTPLVSSAMLLLLFAAVMLIVATLMLLYNRILRRRWRFFDRASAGAVRWVGHAHGCRHVITRHYDQGCRWLPWPSGDRPCAAGAHQCAHRCRGGWDICGGTCCWAHTSARHVPHVCRFRDYGRAHADRGALSRLALSRQRRTG